MQLLLCTVATLHVLFKSFHESTFLFASLCEQRFFLHNVAKRAILHDNPHAIAVCHQMWPCFVIAEAPKQMAGSTFELSATLLAGLSQVGVGLLSSLVQVAGVRAFC